MTQFIMGRNNLDAASVYWELPMFASLLPTPYYVVPVVTLWFLL